MAECISFIFKMKTVAYAWQRQEAKCSGRVTRGRNDEIYRFFYG